MSTVLKPTLRSLAQPSILTPSTRSSTYICQPCRHARLLRRPKRPYTFTQLVTLSDGSAFTMRTTSPLPVYRSTRDTRNAPLWNPNSKDLQNVEEDEAGRLAGFRARFGTGFDANRETGADARDGGEAGNTVREDEMEGLEDRFSEEDANLMDLISSYNVEDKNKGQPWQLQKEKKDKKK